MTEKELSEVNASLEKIRRSIVEMKTQETTSSACGASCERLESGLACREESNERRASRSRKFWKFSLPPFFTPILLYALTWISTTLVGYYFYSDRSILEGFCFSGPLMTILTCHEIGHFLQSRRYGVASTLPYFIPVPFPPLGTFGAIIRIKSRIPSLKALFDIGVSGPLAGLPLTLIFLVVGMLNSTVAPKEAAAAGLNFGEPLIFKFASRLLLDYDPLTEIVIMHPTCLAAWVGVLLTTINLLPVGQLDGGHVFFALTRKYAKACSYAVYGTAAFLTIFFERWNWTLFLAILFFLGLKHPNVTNDERPLDLGRVILGWAALAFVIVGFTPDPITVGP